MEYVLYELSYPNLIMLSATLPTYDSERNKKEDKGEVINADDPRNADAVKNFFKNCN